MIPRTTTVPVTTYKQVTVDEGCWQRVWVPKMVTKQIQCTQYQKQTSYVKTPIQVRKRVQVTVPQSFDDESITIHAALRCAFHTGTIQCSSSYADV